MIKKTALLMLAVCSSGAVAEETEMSMLDRNIKDHYGYSYMTFGVENVTYQESYSASTGAHSDVTVTSPILNTGSLSRINDKFDFSIDALATFSPNHSIETWKDNSGATTLTNELEYMRVSTNVMLHYKLTPVWRVITGPSLTYQTYTRSDRDDYSIDGSDGLSDEEKESIINASFREGDTWEENSTDIFWDVGFAYDPGTLFTSSKWHKQLKVAVGMPLWSETENSRFSGTTFNAEGYRAYIDGSISYEVMEGIHLGWYLSYSYQRRYASDYEEVTYLSVYGDVVDNKSIILPDADTYYLSTGLQVLWKL